MQTAPPIGRETRPTDGFQFLKLNPRGNQPLKNRCVGDTLSWLVSGYKSKSWSPWEPVPDQAEGDYNAGGTGRYRVISGCLGWGGGPTSTFPEDVHGYKESGNKV